MCTFFFFFVYVFKNIYHHTFFPVLFLNHLLQSILKILEKHISFSLFFSTLSLFLICALSLLFLFYKCVISISFLRFVSFLFLFSFLKIIISIIFSPLSLSVARGNFVEQQKRHHSLFLLILCIQLLSSFLKNADNEKLVNFYLFFCFFFLSYI